MKKERWIMIVIAAIGLSLAVWATIEAVKLFNKYLIA